MRWAAVLAGAALAVAPAAAQACDDEDERESADVRGTEKLKDEGSRQAYVRSVEKMGSDEERARALVKLMADAPISEATGASILEVASRMQSDQALGKVRSFFHEIQESDLVRGPLAQKYLDAASRLRAPEALARALVRLLHPEAVPDAAVSRALELSQRIASDEGVAKVLREVTDHQSITADVEARVRALAGRIQAEDLKQRALERLERAKGGDRHASFRREFRFPRFAFRFGDEGRTLSMPVPPVPPMPPVAPVPPVPPAPPMAPVPPVPPTPPLADVPVPGDGEVAINGRVHTLTPEERDAIYESARKVREQAHRMREQIREQMRQMRRQLREDLRRRGEREDIDGSEFDLDLDLDLNG